MDLFGDDFTAAPEVDPAAEFLAREQDQLAGLDDDLLAQPEAVQPAEPQQDGFLLDAFEAAQDQPPVAEEAVLFESDAFSSTANDGGAIFLDAGLSETAIDAAPVAFVVEDPPAPAPAPAPVAAPAPAVNYGGFRDEPEKIMKWREDQKLRLAQKDEEEERRKKEMKMVAAKELEDWLRSHKETVEKTRATNRESAMNAERDFVSVATEAEVGQEWERIAKLCDFNPKASRNSKDVSRMRSIILQLKQSPPVRAGAQ